MECVLCNMRSAAGTCAECQILVCEECGVQCEHCGKWACPEHVYMTSSGKTLCLPCQEERRARHQAARRRAAGEHEGAEPVFEGVLSPAEPEPLEEVRVLVESVRQPPPPWKLSLYTAGIALVLVGILFVFPALRRIPMPNGTFAPTPYILLVIPVIAVFWGILGYVREDLQSERNRSAMGVGLAIIASILMFVAVHTDPARQAELEALRSQTERERMSPAELERFREEKLQKYRR